MAVAYRHQGLGSPRQVIHFIHERLYELKELIRNLEAELEMWTVLAKNQGDAVPELVRGQLAGRREKLEGAIDTDKYEYKVLEQLLVSLKPCPKCKGTGERRVEIRDDEASGPCRTCNGSATQQ